MRLLTDQCGLFNLSLRSSLNSLISKTEIRWHRRKYWFKKLIWANNLESWWNIDSRLVPCLLGHTTTQFGGYIDPCRYWLVLCSACVSSCCLSLLPLPFFPGLYITRWYLSCWLSLAICTWQTVAQHPSSHHNVSPSGDQLMAIQQLMTNHCWYPVPWILAPLWFSATIDPWDCRPHIAGTVRVHQQTMNKKTHPRSNLNRHVWGQAATTKQ